nr:putative capsid [Marmot picobirnavirus]
MATANQISAQKLEEEKRANHAQEEIKRDDQKLEKRGQNLSFLGRFVPSGKINMPMKLKGGNSPDWYNGNPQIAKDAANLSFNAVAGTNPQIEKYTFSRQGGTSATKEQAVPGIMVLNYIPVLPHSGSDNKVTHDVIIAFQSQYVAVRKRNSGAKNYDVSNYVSYIYALHGFVLAISDMIRAYQACITYKDANSYFGEQLVRAMGYDYASLSENLADFRTMLNTKIQAFNAAFKMPVVMPWFLRAMWMNTRVFKDSDIPQAQLYLYKTEGFYKYGDLDTTSKFIKRPINMTATDCNNLLTELFNAILFSEDAGTISGDIEKEFDGSLFKIKEVAENDVLEVVLDDRSLNQIQNIEFKGKLDPSSPIDVSISLTTGDISQVIQLQVTDQLIPATGNAQVDAYTLDDLTDKRHITISNDKNLTPAEVLEISKCKAEGYFFFGPTQDTSATSDGAYIFTRITHCNTEVFTYGQVFYNGGAYTRGVTTTDYSRITGVLEFGQIPVVGGRMNSLNTGYNYVDFKQVIETERVMSNFDWAPMLPWYLLVLEVNQSESNVNLAVASSMFYSGDIGRFAPFDTDVLDNMNTAIVHSVFAINKFAN